MGTALDLLAFITRSNNRVRVLLALVSGPFTRTELQEQLGVPRATLSRILADFWERELVTRDGHEYRITPLGEHIAFHLRSMSDSIETMRTLQAIKQWLPLSAFNFDLNALATADVILQTRADPHAPLRSVVPALEAADHVRGLCDNAVHEPLLAEWRAVTSGRQRFEAVVTADLVDVIARDPERADRFSDVVAAVATEAFVYDGDIPCLIVIADETVLLEATDEEGAIKAFILTGNEAVRSWAEATFEAHKRAAEPFGVEFLTA